MYPFNRFFGFVGVHGDIMRSGAELFSRRGERNIFIAQTVGFA
jgi:hypothetical protein